MLNFVEDQFLFPWKHAALVFFSIKEKVMLVRDAYDCSIEVVLCPSEHQSHSTSLDVVPHRRVFSLMKLWKSTRPFPIFLPQLMYSPVLPMPHASDLKRILKNLCPHKQNHHNKKTSLEVVSGNKSFKKCSVKRHRWRYLAPTEISVNLWWYQWDMQNIKMCALFIFCLFVFIRTTLLPSIFFCLNYVFLPLWPLTFHILPLRHSWTGRVFVP